ncbi:MAG: DNA mismatch repair protein MutS [Dehalococcoidia bacterium]|nr:DNA mismatch repair protein MutS [Dehalococcoidia bacterium]
MTTPIWSQYLRIKKQYQGIILLFRLGDFYETFNEDAETVARELEITLTSRPMGKGLRVPLAGIPYHALEPYLSKLISKGYRVAICEQTSDPRESKGLTDREVVRVVTPGTVVEPALLKAESNNYLAALVLDGEEAGLAYVDISTSHFSTTQLPFQEALNEIERLGPSEILIEEGSQLPLLDIQTRPTEVSPRWFQPRGARQTLLDHFGISTLEAYGCESLPLATAAAGCIVRYLQETKNPSLSQIQGLSTYHVSSFMALDARTRLNLEIFRTSREQSDKGSLLSTLDHTKTPMGKRALRTWLSQPLMDLAEIRQRHDAVQSLFSTPILRSQLYSLLGKITDLERLVNRVRTGLVMPRELLALAKGLEAVPKIKSAIANFLEEDQTKFVQGVRECPEVVLLIKSAISVDTPATLNDPGIIKSGFSTELDAINSGAKTARAKLASMETRERDRTGIKSLKVGYNRVFGYYIEISNSYRSQAPSDYIRKQTLTGAERYYTPEIKELEVQILDADERQLELERALYRQVCSQIAESGGAMAECAQAIARMDVFVSLAEAAARNNYTRPMVTAGDELRITDGRHPVVESMAEQQFVPNDAFLDNGSTQIAVITGPNMSGKSTYLRQIALIVVMAQIGSFVPAESSIIPLTDRIFTRIGAQDDLSRGESTFMVEMVETANILHHATERSLVILDEVGRGTSTYDGISIARAVVEHLHNQPSLRAKTLFATHYHELTELASFLPRVKNLHFAVSEAGGKVVFLRTVLPGGADKSYGIHVAQLAGLPSSLVHRAQDILEELEEQHSNSNGLDSGKKHNRGAPSRASAPQLALFSPESEVLQALALLDVSSMTPLEAINKLYELQKKVKGEGASPRP